MTWGDNVENKKRIIKYGFFLLLFFFLLPQFSHAAGLTVYSDLISSSAPATTSNHTIQFTTTTAVPAGGKIIITPDAGAFSIPSDLDHTDFDLLVATTTDNYVNRSIATTTTGTTDSVGVASGLFGHIQINLNTTDGIAAGNQVRIIFGTNATFELLGDKAITNPTTTQSYRVAIRTEDAASTTLDIGSPSIAIVGQVTIGPVDTTEQIPPFRFNGLPSGELASGITSVVISLETDEFATCRYDTASGTPYDSMTNVFSGTGSVVHTNTITGTVDDTTYTFYVRCVDDENNKNPDDFIITFSIAETPPPGSGGGSSGGGGGGGGGGSGGGSGSGKQFPGLTAKITFIGLAYPLGSLTVLQGGEIVIETPINNLGEFNVLVENITDGTHTFGLYATDPEDVKGTTFNSTISIVGGTSNTLTGLILSPTITLDATSVDPGEIITARGFAAPDSDIQLQIHRKKVPVLPEEIITVEARSDSGGLWSAEIDTTGFFIDTYQLRGKVIKLIGLEESEYSDYVFFGAGVVPDVPAGNPSDLNRDGFVNLIDFSILLFHWQTDGGTSDPPADINQDGNVNLIDFSIMIFNWTG